MSSGTEGHNWYSSEKALVPNPLIVDSDGDEISDAVALNHTPDGDKKKRMAWRSNLKSRLDIFFFFKVFACWLSQKPHHDRSRSACTQETSFMPGG